MACSTAHELVISVLSKLVCVKCCITFEILEQIKHESEAYDFGICKYHIFKKKR